MVSEETDCLPKANSKSVISRLDVPGMVAPAEGVSSRIPEISQPCVNLAEAPSTELPLTVEKALVKEENNRTSNDADMILDQEFSFQDRASTLEIQGLARSNQGAQGSCSLPSTSKQLTSKAASSGDVQPLNISHGESMINVSANASVPNNSVEQKPQAHFPLFSDPYEYELNKLRREAENLKRNFEETTAELVAELERKMAEARSEYDRQSQVVNAAYNAKVVEQEAVRKLVGMNSLLANAFVFKSSKKCATTEIVGHHEKRGLQNRSTNRCTYRQYRRAKMAAKMYVSGKGDRATATSPMPCPSHAEKVRFVASKAPVVEESSALPHVTSSTAARNLLLCPVHSQLAEISGEDKENSMRFYKAVAEVVAVYNRTVGRYELKLKSLRDKSMEDKKKIETLSAEFEVLSAKHEKDKCVVRKAKERIELELRDAKISRDDFEEKFRVARLSVVALTARLEETEARANALVHSRELDIQRAVKKAKKTIAGRIHAGIEQVKLYIAAQEAVLNPFARVCEITANFELLEEIINGDITDFKSEFEVVSVHKNSAQLALTEAKKRIPKLDLNYFEHLIIDSPSSS